ncbi:MAG: leucine-rich repeat protein, partial [Lachnospiraceae bacterium]|nr:leucine-rich repeat protein [Lachnospiraceae bacterium]
GNERVKTVLCPDGLKEIREQAFAGCLTLQNIELPSGLERIGREAFAECRKLLKCNVPETVLYIGNTPSGAACS